MDTSQESKGPGATAHADAVLTHVQATAGLAQILERLSAAANEAELLAAVAPFAAPTGPVAMQLVYLFSDAAGVPNTGRVVARWTPETGATAAPESPPFQLSEAEPYARWLLRPEEPVLSSSPPGVMVPLRGTGRGAWKGLLVVAFEPGHEPDAQELRGLRLVGQTLAPFVTSHLRLLGQQAVVSELTELGELSAKLSAADTLNDALCAAVAWAIDAGAETASLAQILLDADGQPLDSELVAEWRREPGSGSSLGRRFVLRASPLAQRLLENPGIALCVGDIETDARVDETARAIFRARGLRATALLPLRVRGRWVGLVSASWTQPRSFSERELRQCQTIMSQAAIVLDNRLLMDKMQAALVENQRQRLAFKAMFDHLPVGVCLAEVPSGKVLFVNPKGIELLGRGAEPGVSRETYHEFYRTYHLGTDRPMDGNDLPMVRTIATGQPSFGEMDILKPDGSRISLEVNAVPICDENGVMRNALALLLDITGRLRSEAERTRIQNELIQMQASALAERSTPIIPISDDILVLPLVGALDTERGEQLIEVLLGGVSKGRARVAIIDITGVRTLDTQAASALTNAAQALRLLGVEPVLTGIRAEVAQTLVSLGVPLSGIVTRSTLQNGIAYANRRKPK